MNWFYAKNGSQQGPLSTDEIRNRVEMGEIGSTDLAWREGMADWMPVGEIEELKVQPQVREDLPPPVAQSEPAPYRTPGSSPQAAPHSPAGFPTGQKSQGLAIAALVCGILAFIGCCAWPISGPLAIAAIICGHLALGKAKANPDSHGGQGMAKAGLITGYLGLVASIVFGIFAIWSSTRSPQEVEDFFLKWVPEEQREEVRQKLEAEREKQQR